MSDSSRPYGLQPTRLLCPWDFPGKSTRVGCHHLLHNINYDQNGNTWPNASGLPRHFIRQTLPRAQNSSPRGWPRAIPEVRPFLKMYRVQKPRPSEPPSPAWKRCKELSMVPGIHALLLLLLSRFSRVRLCATPQTAAHQAAPSLGFSMQEH